MSNLHPPMDPVVRSRALRDALADVLAEGAVDVGFQPVVDLATRSTVGWEALARGPAGTELEQPDRLFAAARAAGRLDELDWLCQRTALQNALRAGVRAPAVVFLNVEPDTSGFMPLDLRALYAEATDQMTVAVEITERALTHRPAALLGHVADMRSLGVAVALDDVGTDRDSMAMMSVIAPDVIKLDLALFVGSPDAEVAGLINAVTAQTERSGATIVVERVETDEDARAAGSLGADLAQGWLFGARGMLDALPAPPQHPVVRPLGPQADPRDIAPFARLSAEREVRRASFPLLAAMSRQLEGQARALGHEAVLLACFQDPARFEPAADRYAGLAGEVAFVAAIGRDMPSEPAPGVRGGAIAPGEPLANEWCVAVVSPHFAVALSAHELGERDSAGESLYDFVLTYERELAVGTAASLMARVAG
jgi:EAL domain-containing protein (putative c-di-GMP-specific phosphodiesterase class I)